MKMYGIILDSTTKFDLRLSKECTSFTTFTTGHHIGVMNCVSITRHGDTPEGKLASILMVPGPGPCCTTLPLSTELTAGAPGCYVLRPHFILSRLSVDKGTRTWEAHCH